MSGPPGPPGPADASSGRAGRQVDEVEERDPGLARERTWLAWRRTNISIVVIGVAVLKVSPVDGTVLLVIALVAWFTGRRHLLAWLHPDLPDRRVAVRQTAALVVFVAFAALVAVLTR